MERVLITGAAGFLGSHLCERFLNEGMAVVAMDNLITGDLKNIEHLFPHSNPQGGFSGNSQLFGLGESEKCPFAHRFYL